jgi:magnesium chelatase subunit H
MPIRVVVVTMDSHLSGAVARAQEQLRRQIPGLDLVLHGADEFGSDADALAACHADIARGDIVIATMLFLEDHIRAVLPALAARRAQCDAMLCCMAAGEVTKLTRLGQFDMSQEATGALALLKKLRGSSKGAAGASGQAQMKMLRRLPKLMRFIPGTAQDVRAYFLALQYWLAGSEDNIANLIRMLVARYAAGERRAAATALSAAPPIDYPDVGLYHPRVAGRITERIDDLPRGGAAGTVGVLLLRSYLLAGNAAHYDGVIAALQATGLRVIPAFASGLDQRPAIERFFVRDGVPAVDAVVSLTGFSLVGGPAYNDSRAAEDVLAKLDVPYVAAHPVEFQTLHQWQDDPRGLTPVEATMMVAIPELDGAMLPMTFGGRCGRAAGGARCDGCDGKSCARSMVSHPERAATLARRVKRLVALRRTARAQRKLAIVLFNFPPNAGAVGSAAYLSVFSSLHNTLRALHGAGYRVEVPATADELRERIVGGNAEHHGTDANVLARVSVDDHVAGQPWLDEIELQWGAAPGRQQNDGRNIFVLGERFGNIVVGLQPAFGHFARSTAGFPKRSARTRCCISARMARWSSCPANRPGCRPRAGRTG